MDPFTVAGVISSAITILGVFVGGFRWIRSKRRSIRESGFRPSEQDQDLLGARFTRGDFQLQSTEQVATAFPIDYGYAGDDSRAIPGAVAAGDSLVVKLQDAEVTDQYVEVWLTAENRGEQVCRWFGCKVMCYPEYVEIQPEPVDEQGARFMGDLYPGEQLTAYYRFRLSPPEATLPKFITCESWDKPLSFSWARGA